MLQSCKSVDEATRLSAEGQAMLQFIEDSPKPVVSAIMGSCLGGGLEVRTCCVSKLVQFASFSFLFSELVLRSSTELLYSSVL